MPKPVSLTLFLCALCVWGSFSLVWADSVTDPEEILKQCITHHGGWDRFVEIRDIYAKLDVVTYSPKGEIESTFYQYYRKPDKIRIEIHPLMDPPTKISWDGIDAWQQIKDQVEKSNTNQQKERLSESLRFINLMILTNLFEDGSNLRYVEKRQAQSGKFGFHVIAQRNKNGEEILLFISEESSTLLGAQFTWRGTETVFRAFFASHKVVDGMLLPEETRLFKDNDLVMYSKLRVAKINTITNANSFWSDLNETYKPLKKK